MTWYLKYRSQRISELDLAGVRESLTRMLAKENIPHAWLFSGPRGTGKTSSARILAKAINCQKRKGVEPCNECEMCKAITDGSMTDVMEIDAASNRGIDEIRDLREKVRLAPMKARYKVYIIDEVHMLTTEAANALLKTLEEPPERTMFVLCTTEPEKLLETVISRCVRINFTKPTTEEIVSSLNRVVEGEKLKADKEALKLIAKSAKGSFRDATKILEQAVGEKKEITEALVKAELGMLETADPEEFLDLMAGKKYQEALDLVSGLDKSGVPVRGFIERTMELLQERLLTNFGKSRLDKKGQEMILLAEKLDRAYEQARNAAVAVLPLEILVMEYTNSAPETPIHQPAEKQDLGSDPPLDPNGGSKKATVPTNDSQGKYSLEDLMGRWGEVMKAVKPKNHSVEALLRSTRPIEFDGDRLVLEVFYKFHKDKLETEKCRQIVEESVGNIFSINPVKLYLNLGDKPKKTEVDNTDELIKTAEEIFKA